MLPADSASWAQVMPEASRDRSSGTLIMKMFPRSFLYGIVTSIVVGLALLIWPGTNSGMKGAFLGFSPAELRAGFAPNQFLNNALSIALAHGFTATDTAVAKAEIPKCIAGICISPIFTRRFSSQCTASLYICVEDDRQLSIYIIFPRASMFDAWRIEQTMNSIRKDLGHVHESIRQKRI